MAEIDQISRGTVRRVMAYGAIVQLDDGVTGLVHISEIANSYVKDVREYCTESAFVVVQVLRQKEDGRWEFSMKKALNNKDAKEMLAQVAVDNVETTETTEADETDLRSSEPMYAESMPFQPPLRSSASPRKRAEFDEKLRDFLTDSSDHIEDVKRHHENRLGGKRR